MGTLNTGWKLKNIFNFDEFLSQKPLFTTKTDDFAGIYVYMLVFKMSIYLHVHLSIFIDM
jgi:hypothetical protein